MNRAAEDELIALKCGCRLMVRNYYVSVVSVGMVKVMVVVAFGNLLSKSLEKETVEDYTIARLRTFGFVLSRLFLCVCVFFFCCCNHEETSDDVC